MIFLLAISVTGIFIWQWRSTAEEKEWIRTLKHSEEPDLMANTFLRYLIENQINLAKELVIPEQHKRIDKWIIDSKHDAFKCAYDWKWVFEEPLQTIAGGSGGSIEIDENTMSANESYFCYNSEHLMRANEVIIHFNGAEWVITGWTEICEATPSKTEICYQ